MSERYQPECHPGKNTIILRGADLGLPPDSELSRQCVFRPFQEGDMSAVQNIMGYWLLEYHAQNPSVSRLVKGLYNKNINRLTEYADGGYSPGEFYILELDGAVVGITGFAHSQHMSEPLRSFLNEKQSHPVEGRGVIDLTRQVPEMLLLYTDRYRKPHRDIPLGRIMMNGLKLAVYQRTGAEWSVFTSRAIWRQTGWVFHDRQPDFVLLGELGSDLATEEAGADTRVYLVLNCATPHPIRQKA